MSDNDAVQPNIIVDSQELESLLGYLEGGIEVDITIDDLTGKSLHHMTSMLQPETRFIQPPSKNIANNDIGNFSVAAPNKLGGDVTYSFDRPRVPFTHPGQGSDLPSSGDPQEDFRLPGTNRFIVNFQATSGGSPPKINVLCPPGYIARVTVTPFPMPPSNLRGPPLRFTQRWLAMVVLVQTHRGIIRPEA